MKKTAFLKITSAALVSAIATFAARADIDINDNVTVSGYAAGSFRYSKAQSNSSTTADLDAAKLAVALKYDPFSANISIYADTGAHQLYLLDAYGTYAITSQFSVTAGRFLSYIGFTPFDIPDKAFITGAVPTGAPFTGTPGYHEGARVDFKQGNWSAGFAALDSLYSLQPGQVADRTHYNYRGDGSIRDGAAIEAKLRYTAATWTANLSLGYEAQKQGYNTLYDANGQPYDPYKGAKQIYIADLWGKWKPTEKTTLGGEIFYRRDYVNQDSAYLNLRQNIWYILLQGKQQVDENYAFGARVSFGGQSIGNYWKFTLLPISYTPTKNIEVRGEVSYTKYSSRVSVVNSDGFAGIEAIIKF